MAAGFRAPTTSQARRKRSFLPNAYWERRFGGDPGVIGRAITLDSRPRQVIGIMPATFTLASAPIDLLLPLRINLAQPPSDWNYRALARLKKGVTVAHANADVARMLPVYLERYAGHRMDALHFQPAVRPFKEDVVGNVGQGLWVLLGGISILLLIACATSPTCCWCGRKAADRNLRFAPLGAPGGDTSQER